MSNLQPSACAAVSAHFGLPSLFGSRGPLKLAVALALTCWFATPAHSAGICPSPALANNTDCTVTPGSTLTVTPAGSTGLSANGAAGQIIGDGITVNLGAATTTGAMALTGAVISFNSSVVATTSVGAAATGQVGVQASGVGSTVSASNATIDLTPNSGTSLNMRGATADSGGTATLSNTTVQVTGGANGTGNFGLVAATQQGELWHGKA